MSAYSLVPISGHFFSETGSGSIGSNPLIKSFVFSLRREGKVSVVAELDARGAEAHHTQSGDAQVTYCSFII